MAKSRLYKDNNKKFLLKSSKLTKVLNTAINFDRFEENPKTRSKQTMFNSTETR